MKKLILIAVLALLVIPSLALAQGGFQQSGDGKPAKRSGGGFTGPNDSLTTVAEALKMADDARVTLVGKIEAQLGHEKYRFSDGTGSITVEIDGKRWRGLEISPEDTVELVGEIDRDSKGLEVDVKRITKR